MSDPVFTAVSLLLHFDGSNGSTTFTDDSGFTHTVTATGDAALTTTSPKFGTASMKVTNGSADITTTTDLQLAGGDFTIEGWATSTDATQTQTLISCDDITASPFGGPLIQYLGGFSLFAVCFTSGGGNVGGCNGSGSVHITTGVPFHWAYVRFGNQYTLYQNGVQVGTASSSTLWHNPTTIHIGNATDGSHWLGTIDEVRITKGVANYTTAFTPPTSAFPGAGGASPTGTIASTQQKNTMAASGLLSATGTIASTQQKNTTAFTGQVNTPGAWSSVQQPNTMAASGGPIASGAVAVTQQKNVAAFFAPITGTIAPTQQPNIAVFSNAAPRSLAAAQTLLGPAPAQIAVNGTPAQDPYFASVVLLLHCDVADAGLVFPDSSNSHHWMTCYGNRSGSSSGPVFGSGCAFGTNGGMGTPDDGGSDFDLSSGDWTAEGWAKTTTSALAQILFATCPPGASGATKGLTVAINTSGEITAAIIDSSGSGAGAVTGVGHSVTTGTWFHWAASFNGTTLRVFLNGLLVGTGTPTAAPAAGGWALVGSNNRATTGAALAGRFDEIRITKGVGRYTSTFTAPTAAYPDAGSLTTLNAVAVQNLGLITQSYQVYGAGGRSAAAATTLDPFTQVYLVSQLSRVVQGAVTLAPFAQVGTVITTADRNLITYGDPYYGNVAWLINGDSVVTSGSVNHYLDASANHLDILGSLSNSATDSLAFGGKAITFVKSAGSYIANNVPVIAPDRTTSTHELRARFDTLTGFIAGTPVPGSPGQYTFDGTQSQAAFFFSSGDGGGALQLGLAGGNGLYQADWTTITLSGSSINFAPYVLQLKGYHFDSTDITHTQFPINQFGTHEVLPGWHSIAIVRSTTDVKIYLDGVLDMQFAWDAHWTFMDESFVAGADMSRGFGFHPEHTNLSAVEELRLTFGQARYSTTSYAPATTAFPLAQPVLPNFAQVGTLGHNTGAVQNATLPAFPQVATIFQTGSGRSAVASTNLDPYVTVGTFSGVGVRQLGQTYQIPPFSQLAYIAPTRLILQNNQPQPPFTNVATISTGGRVATAAQTLVIAQVAAVSHPAHAVSEGATMPPFGQVATAATLLALHAGQIILPFDRTATIVGVDRIVGAQLIAPFIPTTLVQGGVGTASTRGYRVVPEVRTLIPT